MTFTTRGCDINRHAARCGHGHKANPIYLKEGDVMDVIEWSWPAETDCWTGQINLHRPIG